MDMEILYFSLINQQYGHSLKTFQCKYSEQCLGGRTLRDLIKALGVFFSPKEMNVFTIVCKQSQAVSLWINFKLLDML